MNTLVPCSDLKRTLESVDLGGGVVVWRDV